MIERRIPLKPWEVRALAAGRLSVLWRPLTWPLRSASDGHKRRLFTADDVELVRELLLTRQRHPLRRIRAPYGAAGDTLVGLEPWRVVGWGDEVPFAVQFRDGVIHHPELDPFDDTLADRLVELWIECGGECEAAGMILDDCDMYVWPDDVEADLPTRWRSPVTMPSWASRWRLPLVDSRPARLRDDVTWQDGVASGTADTRCCSGHECACFGTWIDPIGDLERQWTIDNHRHPWATSWAWRVEIGR